MIGVLLMEKKERYSDMTNVEKQRNFLTSEEFPEGAYGSPYKADEPVENKSTPWQDGQQYMSAFTYENRALHKDLPRQYPGAHPPHDENQSDSGGAGSV
jgi:hypothetical protein